MLTNKEWETALQDMQSSLFSDSELNDRPIDSSDPADWTPNMMIEAVKQRTEQGAKIAKAVLVFLDVEKKMSDNGVV